MPLAGYTPEKIVDFRGLNTLVDPTNLDFNQSPDCPNVEFFPGLVRSRPGTTRVYPSSLIGLFNVTHLKTFIDTLGQVRTMVVASNGALLFENMSTTPGSLATIYESNGSNANSVSLFGREYFAFSDGQNGADVPIAFQSEIGYRLDRVSQGGPGRAPSVADENASFNIFAGPSGALQSLTTATISATGASQVGNVCTLQFTISVNFDLLQPGDQIKVAGVGVAGYNGTFSLLSFSNNTLTYYNPTSGLAASGGGTVVTQIALINITAPAFIPPGSTVTIAGVGVGGYNGTWTVRKHAAGEPDTSSDLYVVLNVFSLADSGGGTVTVVGNIVAGPHEISVFFVTRNGLFTAPAPPITWTAVGGKRAIVSNIPIGPADVIQRIVVFTPVQSESFYYTDGSETPGGNMIVDDNTTTTIIVDFTDEALLNGVNVDSQFDLVPLAFPASVTEYSSRLFWIGDTNVVTNFVNLGFDGGTSVTPYPLGWTVDAVNGGGGQVGGSFLPRGDVYYITGNGVNATRGLITQSAFKDYLEQPIIKPSTAYSIRALAWFTASGGAGVNGTLHIKLSSVSASFSASLDIPITSLIENHPLAFSADVITYSAFPAVPTDLILSVYADGTPNVNTNFVVDEIQIYPTENPYLTSTIRVSEASAPDAYNIGTDPTGNGLITVAPENGQSCKVAFPIRDFLYIVKERSLYVTQDDGQNEPSLWSVGEISSEVGTPSFKGVGVGDEWAVIASQSGLWYFTGGQLTDDSKLSTEIQPTWDNINWNYGYLITVTVDTKRKRIYVSVPMGSSTVCNQILTLDYTAGFGLDQRKWSPWLISSGSHAMILRPDGSFQYFIGNGVSNGKIYQLDDTYTVHSDDGAAFTSYWRSGYFQDTSRMQIGYLNVNAVGSGSLFLSLFKNDQEYERQVRGWTLASTGKYNLERQLQMVASRIALQFKTSNLNDFFILQNLALYARAAAYTPVRGVNF